MLSWIALIGQLLLLLLTIAEKERSTPVFFASRFNACGRVEAARRCPLATWPRSERAARRACEKAEQSRTKLPLLALFTSCNLQGPLHCMRAVRACKAAGAAGVPGPRTATRHPQAACRARARTERVLPRLLHRGGGAGLTWGRAGWTDYRSVPRKYSTTRVRSDRVPFTVSCMPSR